MFSIVKKKETSEAYLNSDNLSEILIEMLQYGHPRLAHLSTGWHCCVNMNTNTEGTKFEIMSEFGMSSPLEATKQCHERIISTLQNLTK